MKAKKIKHVLNCLTPTQRKFAMPAAQDKIVYLYFICNCKLIVKSVAYVSLMFSSIVIDTKATVSMVLFIYVNESTGSWHGDLRCYKHKNLLVIFLFTQVASGSPARASLIFFANLLRAICK